MADSSCVIVLDANLPYIRHPDQPDCSEESRIFNILDYTLLPLLRSCTAMETEGVSFAFAISFSPTLCEMLSDPLLRDRYIEHIDRSVTFALSELDRCQSSPETRELIKHHLDVLQLNRRDFVDIYDRDILGKFDYFATHGYIEILATTATSCFLPLFADITEALNAQIETGLVSYRKYFTSIPVGFWLPAMAWFRGCETVLKSYGFQYTILESHGLLFAEPAPLTGLFAPATCKNGFSVFARDKMVCMELTDPNTGYHSDPEYLDVDRDIGFDLDESTLSSLFDVSRGRRVTGFRYWSRRARSTDESALYEPDKAFGRISLQADDFLARRAEVLDKASAFLENSPVTQVLAFPASFFGQTWYEGISWLETVFRKNSGLNAPFTFALPSHRVQYKYGETAITPCFSSWTDSGYAEEVLNSNNDWMYPYIRKATERMIDLAERFPDDTGLKERSLNMAARELLLAQSMDWATIMNESDRSEYARWRFEESVHAFTVVYESLGSNFISTEWLTTTEKKHNLFPEMNYRVFSKKK